MTFYRTSGKDLYPAFEEMCAEYLVHCYEIEEWDRLKDLKMKDNEYTPDTAQYSLYKNVHLTLISVTQCQSHFSPWNSSYVAEGHVRFEFCPIRYLVYMSSAMYVIYKLAQLNPKLQYPGTWSVALQPPTACVIAQQYSSATFVSLLFYYRKENLEHFS
jgi:hypothetical protein